MQREQIMEADTGQNCACQCQTNMLSRQANALPKKSKLYQGNKSVMQTPALEVEILANTASQKKK